MPVLSLPVSFSGSLLALVLALAALLLLKRSKRQAPPASYPPGPTPVPLIGNVRDLTAKELWLPAQKWAKQYGEVVYLHVLGIGLVFINSPEAAIDLLDKRGGLYADKPSLVMAGDLCGCKNMVAFTPYGDQSKRQRKLLHKALGAPTIPQYHPLLLTNTHVFLRALVKAPALYPAHIRRYAGGLTLSVIYGYQAAPAKLTMGAGASITTTTDSAGADDITKSSKEGKKAAAGRFGVDAEEDPYLKLAEECVGILSEKIASGGGVWAVDVFPSLRYLPDWMPGAGFKRSARKWKKRMEEFVDAPFEYVRTSMKLGNYKPSFCSMLLEDPSVQGTDRERFEFDLKWSANSMYSASIDTTITAVSHFMLAMLMHPEAQRRAQAELDAVVGADRLPTFEDREKMPFVEAIYKECLRWGVPVPLNLPHRLMEDDVYKGMFIPKGTLVFGNIWAMLRNEELYPDADAFKPERFLEPCSPEVERRRDPNNYVFGFGRRQCPGENLVDSSVWLLIASMLATLNISKAVDEQGNVVEPVIKFENPIFRTPSKFECDMRPRSPKALSLIEQADLFSA